MHVEPESPRYSLETTADGLKAVIPARRNWLVILFLCAWLVGWALGEIQAIKELFAPSEKSPTLFLMAWLAGWTIGGAYAFAAVIWQLAGIEIISIDGTTLRHRIEALGIGRTRAYKASEVKDLRATEYSTNPFTNQAAFFPPLIGSGFGPVAFDYGARTLRLAPALEEAEAKSLVRQLGARLPRRLNET